MDFHYLVQDAAIFAQNSRRYRKAEALLLPRLENLKWWPLPEDTRNKDVVVEDRLDLHFVRRLTLAIADFKSVFLIPALFASLRARLRSF
jgi:hypothetical protein